MNIDKQIFMATIAGDHRLACKGHLHQEIEKACTILGHIQQPPSCCETKDACDRYNDEVAEGQAKVEAIAQEIYLALTGKKPVFKEDNK